MRVAKRTAQLPPSRIANKAGAAEFFGISVVAFERWVQRGCPVTQRGSPGVPWQFDLLDLAKWRFGKEEGWPTGQTVDVDGLPPRDRKDWYDSELKRSQLAERNGDLIPVIEYQRELSAVIKSVVAGLQTLPDILERDAGLSGDAVERAQAVIDALRDDLYRALTEDAKAAA